MESNVPRKSKGHIKVGKLLKAATFKYVEEYPVKLVNSNTATRGFFDWAILDLKVVIEVNGEQHYKPVDFSGKDYGKAILAFEGQKIQDREKERAAVEAGWSYVAISYKEIDSLDADSFWAAINNAIDKSSDSVAPKPSRPNHSPRHLQYREQMNEKARQQRKRRYEEFKKKHKKRSK